MDHKIAIDKVIEQFFSVFDNRHNKQPDTQLFNALFVNQGIIIKHEADHYQHFTPQQFIEPRVVLLTDGRLVDFHEYEVYEKTDIIGNIAQRKCSYRKKGQLNGQPFDAIGSKIFQLINDKSQWKICSMIWDDSVSLIP